MAQPAHLPTTTTKLPLQPAPRAGARTPSRCTRPEQVQSDTPAAPRGLDPLRLFPRPAAAGAGLSRCPVAAAHSGGGGTCPALGGLVCSPGPSPTVRTRPAHGPQLGSHFGPAHLVVFTPDKDDRSRSTRLLQSGLSSLRGLAQPQPAGSPILALGQKRAWKEPSRSGAWAGMGSRARRPGALPSALCLRFQRGAGSCLWGGRSAVRAERGNKGRKRSRPPVLSPVSVTVSNFFFTRNRSGNMG